MHQSNHQGYPESDDRKAYKEIEEQIIHCTPEQAWAMYSISTGMVRLNITQAVKKLIAAGNKALLAQFPELAPAATADHESNRRSTR
ncbi:MULTISPECIES: hypothetical protein [Pseudomonas]|jgi:hypothetical protein|uniref:hypothetical protein n=1 Tax=Pseudomonas TaxID=286 RepID=UPI0008772A60|nr:MULTISPECIES: hypothetical protein [Pseudomonas]MDT8909070.1 hypothetical protein [Pseudomonas prosekii]NHN68130.1 hypothetical protein [Pseudomonas fluorescens]ROO36058.1 hypothetical protein BIV08_22920 [Pseudomonas sp. AF76]ROO40471.1 hypothetical protein BIV09_10325 [Pseudomonas sp. 7SR1]SCX65441.1 hypothetical protein SAMN03159507_03091 [Pseudomonas sp. NFACC32-1]